MKRFYMKFRVMLLTLALGLSSVPFYRMLHERWTENHIDVPQVESHTPIIVTPYKIGTIVDGRDLSLYDNGGFIPDCDRFQGDEARQCYSDKVKARDFIWDHWKNKKLGYIVLEFKFDNSYRNTNLFIEPSENGKWKVVDRCFETYSWGKNILSTDFEFLTFDPYIKSKYSPNGKERELLFLTSELYPYAILLFNT